MMSLSDDKQADVIDAFKDKDYCLMELICKGPPVAQLDSFSISQNLMGPQEGTYLYGTQFHSSSDNLINILS